MKNDEKLTFFQKKIKFWNNIYNKRYIFVLANVHFRMFLHQTSPGRGWQPVKPWHRARAGKKILARHPGRQGVPRFIQSFEIANFKCCRIKSMRRPFRVTFVSTWWLYAAIAIAYTAWGCYLYLLQQWCLAIPEWQWVRTGSHAFLFEVVRHLISRTRHFRELFWQFSARCCLWWRCDEKWTKTI